MKRLPLPALLTAAPFTVAQARALGVKGDRLTAPFVWRPTRGVRTTELPLEVADHARAFAAAATGPFAFSHVTAAQLLGIPMPYQAEDDGQLHIISRTGANRMRRSEVQGHRGLECRSTVEVAGLPVVAPADTWVDLGEMVGPGRAFGLDDIIVAGDAAANLVGAIALLRQAIERRVRPRGKVTLTYALQSIRLGSWSAMETRSRLMVVRAGLPEPTLNDDIVSSSGRWLACSDLVRQDHRTVGEFQGVAFHSSSEQRKHDAIRQRALERDGWTFVEIVNADVFEDGDRRQKLTEIAEAVGVEPARLKFAAAEPQFFAPRQFAPPRRPRAT